MDAMCDACGTRFESVRVDARYCSGRCRTLAYRRRTGQAGTPRRRGALGDTMRGASLDLDRIVRRWVKLAEDDRFPRQRSKLVRFRSDLVRARDALDAILDQWPAPVTTASSVTYAALGITDSAEVADLDTMGAASAGEFEAAVSSARADGDMSRDNVVRHIRRNVTPKSAVTNPTA